jgi:hypothetical protein
MQYDPFPKEKPDFSRGRKECRGCFAALSGMVDKKPRVGFRMTDPAEGSISFVKVR